MKTAGVVLAGGRSSRYGTPKMFELHKGKPFYEHSVHALAANHLSPVIVSTNSQLADRFHAPDIVLSIEESIHNGPLYALYHVMKAYPNPDWFFVLSADIPFVTGAFVNELLQYRHLDYNAIVPVQANKLQPLLALYHRSCMPLIERLLKENKRSFMALLTNTNFKKVPFTSEEISFININTKEEFEEYKKLK